MTDSGLLTESYPPVAWQQIAQQWADLEAASPYSTFFLSARWVETWLEVFSPLIPDIEILLFREGLSQQVKGACLLVRRTLSRGPFPVKCVFLNTAGENEGDGPVIEFNNILCLSGWEEAVAKTIAERVNQTPWDEFLLNGFCQGPPLQALNSIYAGRTEERTVRAAYFVDLQRVRDVGSYEQVLGAKDRARLRQNLRFYGDAAVSIAEEGTPALTMLERLADLHTKSWNSRDQPGAFSSSVFLSFHDKLIRRCGRHGEIQFAYIASSGGDIGILYNMIYRGKVYFYQSGLVYSSNKRVRPGFVCLERTIGYCSTQTCLEEFHFMAGGDHYKEPMSTGRVDLEWIVWFHPNLKNRIIHLLRNLRGRLRRKRPTAQPTSEP